MVIPSTPALPLLAFTCCKACFRFSRSQISSINRFVLAGLSGSCAAESDSFSSLPTSQASPAGGVEKSSSPWIFCRWSLLRFMSYLPLLLVPAFGHRFRLSLSVSPPFGSECLTSFADSHGLLCRLLTSALRSGGLATTSVAEATQSRSPGVSSVAFRAQPPNLRFAPLMDMDFAVSCPLVRRWRLVSGFCPSTRTFVPCFLQTPPRGGSPCIITRPYLHQVGRRTFTSQLLSMPSTQRSRFARTLARAGCQQQCCKRDEEIGWGHKEMTYDPP